VGSLALAVVVVSLLLGSVFLIPVAVWLAIRWALVAQVVTLEQQSAFEALHRSGRLVRLAWLKVAFLIVLGAAVVLVAGPFVGALLILLTNAPLELLNVVAGIVYALTVPFVALVTSYVYFDLRTRDELEPADAPAELPAEIGLAR
jgi:hypothetical protein